MYRNSMTREEIVYRIEQRAKALKIKSHVDKHQMKQANLIPCSGVEDG